MVAQVVQEAQEDFLLPEDTEAEDLSVYTFSIMVLQAPL